MKAKYLTQEFVQIVDITLEAFFEPYQSDSKVCKKKNGTKKLQNSFGNLIYSKQCDPFVQIFYSNKNQNIHNHCEYGKILS